MKGSDQNVNRRELIPTEGIKAKPTADSLLIFQFLIFVPKDDCVRIWPSLICCRMSKTMKCSHHQKPSMVMDFSHSLYVLEKLVRENN